MASSFLAIRAKGHSEVKSHGWIRYTVSLLQDTFLFWVYIGTLQEYLVRFNEMRKCERLMMMKVFELLWYLRIILQRRVFAFQIVQFGLFIGVIWCDYKDMLAP